MHRHDGSTLPSPSASYYKRVGFELDHTGHQQSVSPAETSVACEV